MIKKITWPALFFGPINLWNAPRQDELESINLMKGFAKFERSASEFHKLSAESLDRQIKEREFLYYLHSGRFPE
jgi:hypothetical protein